MNEYADASMAEAGSYQAHNLYSNAQLAAALAQSGQGAPYAMTTMGRNVANQAGAARAAPVVGQGSPIGGSFAQNVTQGGMVIMGHFVPYWQLGLGAAALVGAYFVFGKKKRGRRR